MQRLNHHHLYVFWILAQQGSFTKAAENLAIAQSAVTSQVKSLEVSLGLQLIDRSNRRRPALTPHGREVMAYAGSIFETSAELMRWAIHGEPARAKVLRVGAISGLSRNLQFEFLKPLIGGEPIKIEVTTGDQDRLIQRLVEHSLDVVLSSRNVRSDGPTSFYSHVLTSSPLVFVVPKSKARKRPLTLREHLIEKPLYLPGPTFEAKPELDAFLERMAERPRLAGEIDDIALLRLFALGSGAVVALPQMGVQNDLDRNELEVISRAAKIEQRFYAITRSRKLPNAALEKLIEAIRS